jgi:hypothetical protein
VELVFEEAASVIELRSDQSAIFAMLHAIDKGAHICRIALSNAALAVRHSILDLAVEISSIF